MALWSTGRSQEHQKTVKSSIRVYQPKTRIEVPIELTEQSRHEVTQGNLLAHKQVEHQIASYVFDEMKKQGAFDQPTSTITVTIAEPEPRPRWR